MAANLLGTQPYKGTRDFFPEEMALRNWFFARMRQVAERYCYEEYNGPIVEPFALYTAKSGQELVNEQVYHFTDRGGREIAIRPEMTPTVARMVASRINELSFPLRWYCIANLMRYERPQKGRLREHWQLNMDIFGEPGVKADLEIVSIIVDLMKAFGADGSMFQIRISNRAFFNEVLADILQVGETETLAISKAVDKRAKISREEYDQWLVDSGIAPDKIAVLDEIFSMEFGQIAARLKRPSKGAEDLKALFALLDETGLAAYCAFDFSIVRGFDYYTGTVFEVNDTSPDNRRALFGGGRYDNLIGLFKNSDISGIGFGFGDVTFQNFLQTHGLLPENLNARRKVLITAFPDVPFTEYMKISSQLRDNGISNAIYLDPAAKLKKQFLYAEKQQFPIILIAGPDELKGGKVLLRNMGTKEQRECPRSELTERLGDMLAGA